MLNVKIKIIYETFFLFVSKEIKNKSFVNFKISILLNVHNVSFTHEKLSLKSHSISWFQIIAKTPLLLSVAVFTTLQALFRFDIGYYVTSVNAYIIVFAEQKAIQSEKKLEKKSLPFSSFEMCI